MFFRMLILFSLLISGNSLAQYFNFIGEIQVKNITDDQGKYYKYDVINLKKQENIHIENENIKVKKIQLNYLGKKNTINYNKDVKVTCKQIYLADSQYHFTDILCMVDKISYLK